MKMKSETGCCGETVGREEAGDAVQRLMQHQILVFLVSLVAFEGANAAAAAAADVISSQKHIPCPFCIVFEFIHRLDLNFNEIHNHRTPHVSERSTRT